MQTNTTSELSVNNNRIVLCQVRFNLPSTTRIFAWTLKRYNKFRLGTYGQWSTISQSVHIYDEPVILFGYKSRKTEPLILITSKPNGEYKIIFQNVLLAEYYFLNALTYRPNSEASTRVNQEELKGFLKKLGQNKRICILEESGTRSEASFKITSSHSQNTYYCICQQVSFKGQTLTQCIIKCESYEGDSEKLNQDLKQLSGLLHTSFTNTLTIQTEFSWLENIR